jgi:hypothetical protein
MNRAILLVLGVASGMWMLRDLGSVAEPPVADPSPVVVKSHSEPANAARPLRTAPAVMPGPAKTPSQLQPAASDNSSTVKAVKYNALVQDESWVSDSDAPQLTAPPAKIEESDGAALGKWATGVLGALVQKSAVVAKTATSAIQQERQSSGVAKEQTENVAQRNSSVAPAPVVAPPAAASSALATDAPDEETCEKVVENPAALEKPAVTLAAPEGTMHSDATDAKPIDAAPSAAATPAMSTPAASTVAASPRTTSPAVLPPAVVPQSSAPALAPVAPVRPPLTPELMALSQKVHYALAMYQHQRLLNTGKNACWEVMHRVVSYGAATEVLRDGPGGEPVNAIGWLLWGGRCNSQPLLVLSGGRPMAMVGVGVEGHPGQFLGMLAQSHIRADSPFQLQGQQFTVRDLIEQEKLDCDSNIELTFELISMSYYLKSDDVWTSRNGQQWSISRLVHEEIKQPIQGAACGGSHRLFGLSSAYKMRIAEGKPVDGEFLRAQKYIRAYQSYTLGTIQNRDGSFSTDWFRRPADNGDLDRKIQTTGHILEWLVFSLDEGQLRDPRVVESVDFLATQIVTHPNRAWSVGPLGHALHALAIYESRVFVVSDSRPKPVQIAPSQVTVQPEPSLPARKARVSSVPPQPKADPARSAQRPTVHPSTRPSVGTPNAAAATAELDGPDLGVTR